MKKVLFFMLSFVAFSALNVTNAQSSHIQNGTYAVSCSNMAAGNSVNAEIMQQIVANDTALATLVSEKPELAQSLQNVLPSFQVPDSVSVNGDRLVFIMPGGGKVYSTLRQEGEKNFVALPFANGMIDMEVTYVVSGNICTVNMANGTVAVLTKQ